MCFGTSSFWHEQDARANWGRRETMEERITKQQLMKMYNVNRTTIEEWRRRFRLPMIQISSHKKYIRKTDLLEWENEMKQNHTLV
jgi:hypothetical protein